MFSKHRNKIETIKVLVFAVVSGNVLLYFRSTSRINTKEDAFFLLDYTRFNHQLLTAGGTAPQSTLIAVRLEGAIRNDASLLHMLHVHVICPIAQQEGEPNSFRVMSAFSLYSSQHFQR